MVSHICLLVELGPICNSMAASLCLKSCEDHSLLKSYNGGLWKTFTGLGPFVTLHRQQINKTLTNKRLAVLTTLNFGPCATRMHFPNSFC